MALSLGVMFVVEAERLRQKGDMRQAILSLQNAMACRDLSWSHKVELRLIIKQMKAELE